MRAQVAPHVVDIERVADGERVVDRLLGAEGRRSDVRRRGRAAHEAQERRPVELRKLLDPEPQPPPDPGRDDRRPHGRALRLTVREVGCQRKRAQDLG
jgi:hypothetical protein